MARRTECDASQAAQRLKVPASAFRWARHIGLVPDPDASSWQWSRAAVEALDADAIRAAFPGQPISGGVAADRIAEALGTPNVFGERNVTSFVVRRFIGRRLLTELSANDGSLLHPDQVAEVCRRTDRAELVAADTPLGPAQAAKRLGVRRTDFDWMLRLKWIKPAEVIEVRFGTSRFGTEDVALYTTQSVDALAARSEVDWDQLRSIPKGRRSPLAALSKKATAA
ncbi:hypothetical protein ACIQWL_49380 [Streptomyces mirabilis]|uniref:hypothetical protein n=1 Tax=Streptomyces mirabilis TaxID=68239 RepID=UPI0037FA5D37